MKRDREAGFTLIETLVALAVLATASVAMMGATQVHLRQVSDLEKRTAAMWLAETTSIETSLGIDGSTALSAKVYGYELRASVETSPTSDARLAKLLVAVSDPEESNGQVWARLEDVILKRPRLLEAE